MSEKIRLESKFRIYTVKAFNNIRDILIEENMILNYYLDPLYFFAHFNTKLKT